MSNQVLMLLIEGIMAIVRRHETPETLTDEQIFALLRTELSDGQSMIARRFVELGLPVPE